MHKRKLKQRLLLKKEHAEKQQKRPRQNAELRKKKQKQKLNVKQQRKPLKK